MAEWDQISLQFRNFLQIIVRCIMLFDIYDWSIISKLKLLSENTGQKYR